MEPEEIADDLKTTSTTPIPIAPPPNSFNQNQATSNNSLKSREEGELSFSEENNDFPAGLASRFRDDVPAQRESVQVALTNKSTQLVMTGNSVASRNHPSFTGVNSRNHLNSTHNKGPEKNRVPFVISFSDDDSGSEPEECEKRKAEEFKGNPREADISRRPPLKKPQMPLRSAGNDISKIPGKMSLSRTFASSMTRTNGTSSRNCGSMSAGLRSRLGNPNLLPNKNKPVQSGVLNSSGKLQDLRQFIAIRENQLKLKAAKHKNEIASILSKDQTVLSVKNQSVRNRDSVDILHFESEGQKKRCKVNEPVSSIPNTDDRQYRPATQLVVVPEKSASEIIYQQGRDDRRSLDKELLSGVAQRKTQVKNHSSSSANPPNGADLITNSGECTRITELAESSAAVANRASKTSPNKLLTAGVKHGGELNPQHGPGSNMNSMVLKEPLHIHNSMRSGVLKEDISSKRLAKHKSDNTGLTCLAPDNILEKPDADVNNPSFDLGNMNISETGDMDLDSLMEIEELHDKELEEAQELRHKCEVEERNALKAYRKAQRAFFS